MNTEVTAYLDNAATTFPKPDVVYVAADRFYRTAGANGGRSSRRRVRPSDAGSAFRRAGKSFSNPRRHMP